MVNETDMTLGERLQKLRGGESRNSLATKLEIHPQTLYLYEKDKRAMDVEVLRRICELYYVSADWVLFGKENAGNEAADTEYINSLQRRIIEVQEQLIEQLNK